VSNTVWRQPGRLRLEQIAIENNHLLCKDLPANPCREIVARRTCFAGKRQSQAQNAIESIAADEQARL
jgi:hypothetical protein